MNQPKRIATMSKNNHDEKIEIKEVIEVILNIMPLTIFIALSVAAVVSCNQSQAGNEVVLISAMPLSDKVGDDL